MCPEVLAGCIRQVEELKSYPTAVTSAITLSSSTLTSLTDQRRARNKETLTLFLPFWYEHSWNANVKTDRRLWPRSSAS